MSYWGNNPYYSYPQSAYPIYTQNTSAPYPRTPVDADTFDPEPFLGGFRPFDTTPIRFPEPLVVDPTSHEESSSPYLSASDIKDLSVPKEEPPAPDHDDAGPSHTDAPPAYDEVVRTPLMETGPAPPTISSHERSRPSSQNSNSRSVDRLRQLNRPLPAIPVEQEVPPRHERRHRQRHHHHRQDDRSDESSDESSASSESDHHSHHRARSRRKHKGDRDSVSSSERKNQKGLFGWIDDIFDA